MEWLIGFFVVLIVLAAMAESSRKAEQKKKFKKAYKVDWPNIHGTRKIASESELKKAGLI
jgi:hypothetical protein